MFVELRKHILVSNLNLNTGKYNMKQKETDDKEIFVFANFIEASRWMINEDKFDYVFNDLT